MKFTASFDVAPALTVIVPPTANVVGLKLMAPMDWGVKPGEGDGGSELINPALLTQKPVVEPSVLPLSLKSR